MDICYGSGYLIHYGIKGQKKGVRRYQNEDGTLTPEGRERYLKDNERKIYDAMDEQSKKRIDKHLSEGKDFQTAMRNELQKERKKIATTQQLNNAARFIRGVGYTALGRVAAYRGHNILGAFLGGMGLASKVGGVVGAVKTGVQNSRAKETIANLKISDMELDENKQVKIKGW